MKTETTNDRMDAIDRIAIEAARNGLAVNAGYYRDQELCRQQSREAAAGIYAVIVDSNRYGFYVRPASNLIEGGMRISPNFPTRDEATAWAERHVAEDPARRSII